MDTFSDFLIIPVNAIPDSRVSAFLYDNGIFRGSFLEVL